MKKGQNPFKFGDPVEGEYFLPRVDLEKIVSQFIDNRIHVVLIGPRRFGKTSFVLNLLKNYVKSPYNYVFVDIFNITSHRDFLQQMLRAMKSKRNWHNKLREFIQATAHLRPKFSIDYSSNTGEQSLGIALNNSTEKDIKEMIQDVLQSLGSMGEQVIFVIDEFQKISEINDGGWLEATIRTHMQQLKNVCFFFTGSRRSLIYDMLNNPARPLYRSCQPLEFPAFGDEFTDWIVDRFSSAGIKCEHSAINLLRKSVQNTPNYVQMVCFHLVVKGVTNVTKIEVEEAIRTVVKQNVYAYQTLLNTLTLAQQRALRLAAIESKQIFAKELLSKYEISSSPALASTIKALKEKGILDEEGTHRGSVIFDDPLFAYWLKISFEDLPMIPNILNAT